jgi:hypothetical protein
VLCKIDCSTQMSAHSKRVLQIPPRVDAGLEGKGRFAGQGISATSIQKQKMMEM